jgi:hypothetical protein
MPIPIPALANSRRRQSERPTPPPDATWQGSESEEAMKRRLGGTIGLFALAARVSLGMAAPDLTAR